jgi:hypothetical protein
MKGQFMARKVHVVLEDDISGGHADETIYFGLDGTTYEIDLSEDNARALREALSLYVANGRRVQGHRGGGGGGRGPRGRRGGGGNDRPGQIRAWARENGIEVNERGRIPADLAAKYDAAHQ